MKRNLFIATGVLLAMAGLWGGAYALDVFDWDDWRRFPSAVTALCVIFGGAALAAFAGE